MIGDAIRMYRKLQRYSQKETGKHVGLAQNLVSRIERGERSVSVDELIRFAEFFKVRPTDLLMSSQIHSLFKKERTSVDEESITSTRLDTERKTGI